MHTSQSTIGVARWRRNDCGKGSTMPRVLNHWGAPNSPNNIASIFSIQYICSRKALG